MKTNVKITGVKNIDAVFRGLPHQLTHRILQQANVESAKPLIEAEKLSAPEGPTGNLVDSIGAVKTPFSRAGVIGEVAVGPRRGGRFKGYAGHLVETGTKQRTLKKNGANRGIMPATPFAEPSFNKTKGEVLGRFAGNIGRKLWLFMKRTIKNG